MRLWFIWYVIIFFSLLSSCKQDKWSVDTQGISIQQELKSFHKDLFSLDLENVWSAVPELEHEYGNFFEVYNTHIIRIGSTNQLDYNEKLVYFLTDPDIIGSFQESEKINLKAVFSEINDGFKRYHLYFPDKTIPNIYTHISGFNQSVVVDTNYLAIALDKYLGAKSKYYQMLRTPVYKRMNMHEHKISSDAMMAWAETEFVYNDETDNLINNMIHYGKLQVFLDAMYPEMADSLKWGFSSAQLNWCEKNESQMWVYLVENKLLFSTAFKDIKKYINEGPFTSTFSKKSPARTGRWIGYQIVNSYLKANPDISLSQLMHNTNYQQILNESKYKP